MHKVLIKLDSLIDSLLSKNEDSENIDEVEFDEWIDLVSNYHIHLKENILQAALNADKENFLSLYISNVQTALTALLDKMAGLLNQEQAVITCKNNNGAIGKIILLEKEGLEKTLLFIQQYFGPYFNLDQLIPSCMEAGPVESVQSLLNAIDGKINATNIDEKLLCIALKSCRGFVTGSSRIITYLSLNYYVDLLQEINALTQTNENVNEALYEKLLYLNFNDPLFFDYSIKKITVDKALAEADELNQYLKHAKQLRVKLHTALHNELPSIQEQICNWLEEEKYYLQPGSPDNLPDERELIYNPSQSIKLELAIPVGVLGFLLKLFVAGRIITNKTNQTLSVFFASNCRTAKQESISFDSLYNKYHQASLEAIKITKDILNTLIRLIHKTG